MYRVHGPGACGNENPVRPSKSGLSFFQMIGLQEQQAVQIGTVSLVLSHTYLGQLYRLDIWLVQFIDPVRNSAVI